MARLIPERQFRLVLVHRRVVMVVTKPVHPVVNGAVGGFQNQPHALVGSVISPRPDRIQKGQRTLDLLQDCHGICRGKKLCPFDTNHDRRRVRGNYLGFAGITASDQESQP